MMISRLVSSFSSNRRAASALIFGLSALPILTMVAIAVDFSAAVSAHSKLNMAADAATVATVTDAVTSFSNHPELDFQPSIDIGEAHFRAQAGAIHGVALTGTPSLTMTRDGPAFAATIHYDADYSTFFSGLIGAAIPLGGSSRSVVNIGGFTDLQILMDISTSMLIAGTPDDLSRLANLNGGCYVACHNSNSPYDSYAVSRDNGITLRLDQLESAIGVIATAMNEKNALNRFRLGVYTFYLHVAEAVPLTTDVLSAIPLITGIEPAKFDYPSYVSNGDTFITRSVEEFASTYLAQSSDGSTSITPRKFVFLLTDGIDDVPAGDGNLGDRVLSAIKPEACEALKAKNATVAVLHTVYYDPGGNSFPEIENLGTTVSDALKQCASNGLYFAVSDQSQIKLAMTEMLNFVIASQARYTQ